MRVNLRPEDVQALDRIAGERVDRTSLLRSVVSDITDDLASGWSAVLGADVAVAEERQVSLARGPRRLRGSGLLDPTGQPLAEGDPARERMLIDVREVSQSLMRALQQEPTRLHGLDPRKFELVVAELLEDKGYKVDVTPPSNDGGRDLLVASHDALGSFLYLVECKRYAPDRPVGVDVVRSLHGVVAASQATAGLIVTTSRFTAGSHAFQESIRYRMTLHDFNVLVRWLKAYRAAPAS